MERSNISWDYTCVWVNTKHSYQGARIKYITANIHICCIFTLSFIHNDYCVSSMMKNTAIRYCISIEIMCVIWTGEITTRKMLHFGLKFSKKMYLEFGMTTLNCHMRPDFRWGWGYCFNLTLNEWELAGLRANHSINDFGHSPGIAGFSQTTCQNSIHPLAPLKDRGNRGPLEWSGPY